MASFAWPPTGGGGGVPSYANLAAFPPASSATGTLAIALDSGIVYESFGGAWTPIGSPSAILSIGTIDSQTPSANGAVDHTNQLIMQSASATVPGLVNNSAQTLGSGIKTFGSATLFADGSVSNPGLAFSSETGTGWYRVGSNEPSLAISGSQAIDIFKISSTQINFGFGAAASNLASNPLNFSTTFNGQAVFNYSNLSNLTSAQTILYVGGGPSGGNGITVENHSFSNESYTGGGGVLSAGPNLSFLNICAENGSAYMTFNVGGRTLATEGMRLGLTGTGLTLNKGWGKLILSGATSGALTITPGTTGTVALNLPTANAAGAMLIDVSGNVTFGTTPVADGGTGVTSVTTAPTATAFAGWDANKNLSANNTIDGYTTTVTSATPVVLTVGSAKTQFFTGSTAQTVTLPVTSTLVLGQQFLIENRSSTTTTVQSSGSNTVKAMEANSQCLFTVILITGTTAASWDFSYGISQGAIPIADGGTGATSLATGAISSNGTVLSSGTLSIANGGTAKTSVTTAPTATAFAGWDANLNLSAANLINGYATTVTAAGTTSLLVSSKGLQFFTGSTTQTVTMPVASGLANGQQYQITNLSSGVVTVQSSGANTIQTMASNTVLFLTCSNNAGGTGTASWTWEYLATNAGLALTNPMTTGGDIIYGGSSGVPTRLANGTVGQYLRSGGTTVAPNWQSLTAPTVQKFLTTGTTTGYVFTCSSANATVGATYTNNAITFTVLATIAAGTLLFTTSPGAPAGSGTLTKATGTGDATITFSSATALGTYTAPANCLYVRVRMAGGGGGGGGSGTGSPGNGGTGLPTYFGPSLLVAGGGIGGSATGGTPGGLGGTASLGTGPSGLAITGGQGGGNSVDGAVTFEYVVGGMGGANTFGGAGGSGPANAAGSAAVANTGGGGGGAGANNVANANSGAGGGAGGYVDALISGATLVATFPYAIGSNASGGSAGTNGFAGGNSGSGVIIVDEFYQ